MEIYSDGGARGNPGPAACAFVVFSDGGKVIQKDSKYLGKTTNNFAEYQGVIQALGWLIKSPELVGESPITFYMDSELVVNQIEGRFRVKDDNLKKLMLVVKNLLAKISANISFVAIPRSKNKLADFLVNKRLNEI